MLFGTVIVGLFSNQYETWLLSLISTFGGLAKRIDVPAHLNPCDHSTHFKVFSVLYRVVQKGCCGVQKMLITSLLNPN